MDREYFKNLPDETTPLEASRLNGFLNGKESVEKLVVGKVQTKNLLNSNFPKIASGVTWNGEGTIHYFSSNAWLGGVTWWIPVKAGETYTFSYKERLSNSVYLYIREYDSIDGTILRTITNDGTFLTYTFTIENNGYLHINFNCNANVSNISLSDLQLEKGTNKTSYVNYQGIGYESGINGDGSWIKYSDGTMICYQHVELRKDLTTIWGSFFEATLLATDFPNFPQQFIEEPLVFYGSTGSSAVWIEYLNASTSKITAGYVARPVSSPNHLLKLNIIVIGRWK